MIRETDYDRAQRSLLDLADAEAAHPDSLQWFRMIDETLKRNARRVARPRVPDFGHLSEQKAVSLLKKLGESSRYPFESSVNLRELYGNALPSREYKFNSFDHTRRHNNASGPARHSPPNRARPALPARQSLVLQPVDLRMDFSYEKKRQTKGHPRHSLRRKKAEQDSGRRDDSEQFSDAEFRLPQI